MQFCLIHKGNKKEQEFNQGWGGGGGGGGEEVTDIKCNWQNSVRFKDPSMIFSTFDWDWSKKPIDMARKDALKLVKLPSLKVICWKLTKI